MVSMHVAARAYPSPEQAGLAIHEIVNLHGMALEILAAELDISRPATSLEGEGEGGREG